MWYSLAMTTTSTTQIKNKKLWLVIACVLLAAVWYCFLIVCFLGMNVFTDKVLSEDPGSFYVLSSIAGVAMFYVATALALPFAVWTFKKLKVEAPVVSSITLFMALIFGFTLHTSILTFGLYQSAQIYTALAASMVVAILVYGLLIRPLKHKLSRKKFLIISVGLPLVPLIFYVAHQVWIYNVLN